MTPETPKQPTQPTPEENKQEVEKIFKRLDYVMEELVETLPISTGELSKVGLNLSEEFSLEVKKRLEQFEGEAQKKFNTLIESLKDDDDLRQRAENILKGIKGLIQSRKTKEASGEPMADEWEKIENSANQLKEEYEDLKRKCGITESTESYEFYE